MRSGVAVVSMLLKESDGAQRNSRTKDNDQARLHAVIRTVAHGYHHAHAAALGMPLDVRHGSRPVTVARGQSSSLNSSSQTRGNFTFLEL